jgi:hypothetical protein
VKPKQSLCNHGSKSSATSRRCATRRNPTADHRNPNTEEEEKKKAYLARSGMDRAGSTGSAMASAGSIESTMVGSREVVGSGHGEAVSRDSARSTLGRNPRGVFGNARSGGSVVTRLDPPHRTPSTSRRSSWW